MAQLDRREGRRLFGLDAAAYDRARPGHADGLYEVLVERCGLSRGTPVLEVGPGTGQATRRLLALGAGPLVAIEPDPALAGYLHAAFGARVEIRETTLEDAELEPTFRLAAAASSFHWVDEPVGLARLHRALGPGGWVALWWTLFGDDERPDPFREAVEPLFDDVPRGPSAVDGRPPFALDADRRLAALAHAGFEDAEHLRIPWAHSWDVAGIRGLYGSFSSLRALDREAREHLLDEIAGLAETRFGGRVEKPLLTSLYVARMPS